MSKIHPLAKEIRLEIRYHDEIGFGTCSFVDECLSDTELIAEFGWTPKGKPRTAKGALWAALRAHRDWEAYGADIRATAF